MLIIILPEQTWFVQEWCISLLLDDEQSLCYNLEQSCTPTSIIEAKKDFVRENGWPNDK